MFACAMYELMTQPKERLAISSLLFQQTGMSRIMLEDMVTNWKAHPELKGRLLFDYNRAQRNSKNRDNSREAMLEYKKQLAKPENF